METKIPEASINEVKRLRLINQQIASTHFKSPAKLTDWFGAVQAQDYYQAKWSYGLRLPESHSSDIDQAISEGSITRTWLMRGMLQFVTAEDIRWMLDLLGPSVIHALEPRMTDLGLDSRLLERSETILRRELAGGPRTKEELFAALSEDGIKTEGQHGYLLLSHAGLNGAICFGPQQDKTHTFMLLDRFASPALRPMNREEALAELALRYFSSRGPATLPDFAWWAGLSIKDARSGVAAVASQLAAFRAEEKIYFLPQFSGQGIKAGGIQLLPAFDEYLLGYVDHGGIIRQEYAKQLADGDASRLLPMIISRGEIVGTWKMGLEDQKLRLQTKPFRTFDKAEEQGIIAQANRYIQFLSRRAETEDHDG